MAINDATIQLAHGGGGRLSQQLIQELLLPAFGPADGVLHDAAVFASPGQRLAFTTDSYVVRPLFFPGGDIGRLAVFGSVNDLAMAGAKPVVLSLGLILEEGLAMSTLERVIHSIQTAAEQCGVKVITGDTKVVERGKGDGVYINTSGIGVVEHPRPIHPGCVQPGDALLVSGDLGRHGVAVLIAREELGFRSDLESDVAPLHSIVQKLLDARIELHCLRDLTRGGLASAVDEIARSSNCAMELEETSIPYDVSVQSACDLLGLDPLSMANEGRMLVICPQDNSEQALMLLQQHNPRASRIGVVQEIINSTTGMCSMHPVALRNNLGVLRPLNLQRGDQLPRIC
jgi:hydrogenase expression/formation protein HypE